MRRCGMRRKHHVKFPVEVPGDIKKAFEVKAKKLCDRIFAYQKCVVCWFLNSDENHRTTPHHVLNKGMYEHLRFILMNQLPICQPHHNWAHGEKTEFLHFLLDNLPAHYRFYLNKKDNKAPVKVDAAMLQTTIDELEYYENHPIDCEKLIYEK